MIILCVEYIDLVMIDFLRDGSACLVFCETLPFSGLNGGHV